MKTAKPKKRRDRPFRETRVHHSTEAAEDYTELVLDLIEEQGKARTCEIAKQLGVSHVTALRTMQRLQTEGYLHTAPHQPISLTKKGEKLARYARERHELLVRFFVSLGVPLAVAEIDVEGAEHHFSPTTLRSVETFLAKQSKTGK